jgi:hypothetical protein
VTGPADVTGNYLALMRERGWSWDDLADDFARQAAQPALDGGANSRHMERWARSNADAARARAEQPAERREEPPQDPRPAPPKRTATAPRPARRAAARTPKPRRRPDPPAPPVAVVADPPPAATADPGAGEG